jgi:3-oxoacyl-[acyl-carrier-protein] synthase III
MQHFFSALPQHIVHSHQIEKQLALPDGWIAQRTGIHQRHQYNGGVSDLAIESAQKCIEAYAINPLEIDTVLMATVTPDHPWPATACKVAHAIGAHNAWALDISAACSGFVYALQLIQSLLNSNKSKCILLLTGDCMSSIIDPMDKNTRILFGDACAASIWTTQQNITIEDVYIGCDGSGYHDIIVEGGGSALRHCDLVAFPRLQLEGSKVFKSAVKNLKHSVDIILQRNHIALTDIDWFIPHQANLRIIESLGEQLGIDPSKVLTNIGLRGNTTNASIPLCWADHHQYFQAGDCVLIASFGAGYTYGSAILKIQS